MQKAQKQVKDADDVNKIQIMMDEVLQEKVNEVIERLPNSEELENEVGISENELEYIHTEDGSYCAIECDEQGNRFKEFWYYADGTLYSIDEYDDRGRENVTLWYVEGEKLESYWLYEYDLDDHWTKERQYDTMGNLINVITY